MDGFLRKWIMNAIVAVPLLMWFTEASFWSSFITASIFAIIAWFIGDRLILPASNNMTATLADAALAFFYFWLAAYLMVWALSIGELLVITAAIAVVEWILHRQLLRDDVKEERKADFETEKLATEFGEETGVEDLRKEKEEKE